MQFSLSPAASAAAEFDGLRNVAHSHALVIFKTTVKRVRVAKRKKTTAKSQEEAPLHPARLLKLQRSTSEPSFLVHCTCCPDQPTEWVIKQHLAKHERLKRGELTWVLVAVRLSEDGYQQPQGSVSVAGVKTSFSCRQQRVQTKLQRSLPPQTSVTVSIAFFFFFLSFFASSSLFCRLLTGSPNFTWAGVRSTKRRDQLFT